MTTTQSPSITTGTTGDYCRNVFKRKAYCYVGRLVNEGEPGSMKFFRKQYATRCRQEHPPCRMERRAMQRVEREARIIVTCICGEIYSGVIRNMNAGSVAAHVQADLEPGNRVSISYYSEDPEEQCEVQAIVRRRNGFLYVFDTGLVDVMDKHRETDSAW